MLVPSVQIIDIKNIVTSRTIMVVMGPGFRNIGKLGTRNFRVMVTAVEPKIYEPPHGKTNNLHRRKQRRRSASR